MKPQKYTLACLVEGECMLFLLVSFHHSSNEPGIQEKKQYTFNTNIGSLTFVVSLYFLPPQSWWTRNTGMRNNKYFLCSYIASDIIYDVI